VGGIQGLDAVRGQVYEWGMARMGESDEQGRYALRIQEETEAAVHAAGFPGFYAPGTLTVGTLARIAAVLGESPDEWFPDIERQETTEGLGGPSARPPASPRRELDRGLRRASLGPRHRSLFAR
jgi:hypothetical protein